MAVVGIDLGTTHSLVGVLVRGRPELFQDAGSALIPSIVHYHANGDITVGAAAKQARSQNLAGVVWSSKRFLGKGSSDLQGWARSLPFDFSPSDLQQIRFQVPGRSVTPVEVSSQILRHLKQLAEQNLQEKVTQAVITVPAYFDDSQRQATKFAAELAGLEVLRMVNEPTAACLAYGLDKKAHGTVAVFDLGGGTFDISLLRIQEGVFEVLATGGNTELGGDDFDLALVEGIVGKLGLPQAPQDRLGLWLAKAEQLKQQLSEADEAFFEDAGLRCTVNTTELAEWIHPILEKTRGPVLQAFQDAGLTPQQLTDVLLVGGSTRMPLVRQFVSTLFGREPICSLNPEEVVALGAVVQANILSGQLQGMLLLDVLPLSLGIETMGGIVAKILHRNSPIPIAASEMFTTHVEGQVSVDLHVVQGERELVADNRSLARFQLRGLPPMPAGIPKIEVEFIVDANGILSVRATEQRTGTTAQVAVNPSYGLKDNEVERLLQDAYDHAEQDFERRFLIEARTEAEGLLRATRKSLEKGEGLLEAAEREQIGAAIEALERSLGEPNFRVIRTHIEALSCSTHAFAERLLNHAVSAALKDQELRV